MTDRRTDRDDISVSLTRDKNEYLSAHWVIIITTVTNKNHNWILSGGRAISYGTPYIRPWVTFYDPWPTDPLSALTPIRFDQAIAFHTEECNGLTPADCRDSSQSTLTSTCCGRIQIRIILSTVRLTGCDYQLDNGNVTNLLYSSTSGFQMVLCGILRTLTPPYLAGSHRSL